MVCYVHWLFCGYVRQIWVIRGVLQKFVRFFMYLWHPWCYKKDTICKIKGRPSSFSDIFFNFLLRPLVCLHFESEERVILRRGRSPIFAGYFSISQIPFDLEKSKACFGNGKLSSTYDILSIFPHFQSIKPQKEKNEDMAIQFSQIM